MLTMLNFPGKYKKNKIRTVSVLIFMLSSFMVGCRDDVSIYGPKDEAIKSTKQPPRLELGKKTIPLTPVSVFVQRIDATDKKMVEMIGPEFFKRNKNAVAIIVELEKPLDFYPRAAMPVVKLNNTVITETRIDPQSPQKLIAILPDQRLILERNAVSVFWAGVENRYSKRKTLTFSKSDIQ